MLGLPLIAVLCFYTVIIFYLVQSAGNIWTYLRHSINRILSISILSGTSVTTRNPLKLLLKKRVLWEDIVHVNILLIFICHYFFFNIPIKANTYSIVNRNYSNLTGEPNNNNDNNNNNDKKTKLNPVKVYNNFKEDRLNILSESNGKSGIYYLINNVNGHRYVGSSINLARRMRNYLNVSFLKSKQNVNMSIFMHQYLTL